MNPYNGQTAYQRALIVLMTQPMRYTINEQLGRRGNLNPPLFLKLKFIIDLLTWYISSSTYKLHCITREKF